MTLEGPNGGDPDRIIAAHAEAAAKQIGREAMTVWNTASMERVMQAAGNRSGIDAARDQRGDLQGRQENNLAALAQAMSAPVWDETEGAWTWGVAHVAAPFHEWGAMPHEIRAAADSALVFPWPDMPDEVREEYESQWESTTNMLEEPEVAFQSTGHPGVPAIGFMRHGLHETRRRLEAAGLDVEVRIQ